MLKQIALWMKEKGENQWGVLLDGSDDEEFSQAILNQETNLVVKDNDIVGTFTLLSRQSEWDKPIWGEDSSSTSIY